jgi:hypothetical protein
MTLPDPSDSSAKELWYCCFRVSLQKFCRFLIFYHKIATFFAEKFSFGEITSNCTGFL